MKVPRTRIDGLKEDLVSCAARAYDAGLQTGNGGNLSVRVPGTERIIIKSSGRSFGECTVGNLVTVTMQGEIIEGGEPPSSELPTHITIYRRRPEILAIFHSHSPWAIAAAELFPGGVPLRTAHAHMKLGPIPCIPAEENQPHVNAETLEGLLAISPKLGAFVHAGHGIFSIAETIRQAEYQAELVEETAKIAWLTAIGRKTLGG